MKLSSRAYDLYHAFEKPGCPVCRLTAESVHHYLSSLVYEYVNKPPTHEAVRAARGFCATHGWHIQDQLSASALGVAVLYEGLIRNMLKDMGNVSPGDGRRQVTQAANALAPRAACPACEHRATTEDHLLRNLLEYLDEDEFEAALARSAGLCLPHLKQALDHSGFTDAKTRLLALQQAIWDRLRADLAEYVRLSDYRFADEEMREAGDAARRAIEAISGTRGLR